MALSRLASCIHYHTDACRFTFPAVREDKEIFWRRIKVECSIEWPLLRARWKVIALCLVFQYVHGIFTQLVFRLHEPASVPLKDTGFSLTPELGPEYFWVSEMLFTLLFGSFLLWSVSPFFAERKTFYSIVLYKRLLVHLVCCQALRIASFMSTILPGPAHHCRASESSSRRSWPQHWWQHLIVDVQRQSGHSCGDLIFSSHTTFILSFVLAYHYYGRRTAAKVCAWLLASVLSVLIICSRKHYTVDVVVAWYTVPLVFVMLERRWTTVRSEQPPDERETAALETVVVSSGSYAQLERMASHVSDDVPPSELSVWRPAPTGNGTLHGADDKRHSRSSSYAHLPARHSRAPSQNRVPWDSGGDPRESFAGSSPEHSIIARNVPAGCSVS